MSHFNNRHKDVTFILIDDDSVDRRSVIRSFSKVKIANTIIEFDNAIEALEQLKSGSIHGPYIILLDINMPRMTGLECLKEIRDDPHLKKAVVFILTTSDDYKDKNEAHELNVTGYIVKSDAGDSFLNAINMINTYWKIVEMPDIN